MVKTANVVLIAKEYLLTATSQSSFARRRLGESATEAGLHGGTPRRCSSACTLFPGLSTIQKKSWNTGSGSGTESNEILPVET